MKQLAEWAERTADALERINGKTFGPAVPQDAQSGRDDSAERIAAALRRRKIVRER